MALINRETGKVYVYSGANAGTSLPSTCAMGDTFVLTNATSGEQIYACVSLNTWVQQGGGGGGASWGSVTGTLSSQSDLQTALDGKAATSHTHNASDINAGTLAAARLPNPSATTLGGVQSKTCSGTDKLSSIGTDGVPVCTADQTGGGGLPAGAVVLIVSGSCASTLGAGWAEETSLNGKFVLGTVDASADIGGTGGQDTVTAVLNHTHPVTDPGHTHITQRYPTTTGGSSGFTADTSMSGTLADNTLPTKTATTGITTENPVGGVASIDNRPAFVKVIFCRKT